MLVQELVLWLSELARCLQCWHLIRVPIKVVDVPLLIQLPAGVAGGGGEAMEALLGGPGGRSIQ